MNIRRDPKSGKIIAHRFKLTEIVEADDENAGFCIACGERADGCEPDARKYKCEACDMHQVYGAEELAIMGLVDVDD